MKDDEKYLFGLQLSFEWPIMYKDVVEWKQHPNKSGVFFHEENICKFIIYDVTHARSRGTGIYYHLYTINNYGQW